MSDLQRVMVALEGVNPDSPRNRELMSVASSLARAVGGNVTAVILTDSAPESAEDAIALGADEVCLACAPWLAVYQADAYVAALTELCARLEPEILLMPHNSAGREVAPRLAVRLDAGLVTDCISVTIEPETGFLIGTRPCFSGKALSEWAIESGQPKIATLRRQAVPPAECDYSRTGKVFTVPLPEPRALRARVLEQIIPPAEQVKLEDAAIVVGVGRGVGDVESFQRYVAHGLARVLGAACGGSRAAVDSGIIPSELQIGLTGHMISPKLYVAIGISGAPQHMAGCSGSQCIVAINTDPAAPIFGFAHYGVVGDYRRVVPALTEGLKQLIEARQV